MLQNAERGTLRPTQYLGCTWTSTGRSQKLWQIPEPQYLRGPWVGFLTWHLGLPQTIFYNAHRMKCGIWITKSLVLNYPNTVWPMDIVLPVYCYKYKKQHSLAWTLPYQSHFGVLWNARSVCNKLPYIHEIIISHNLSFLPGSATTITDQFTMWL